MIDLFFHVLGSGEALVGAVILFFLTQSQIL
jgi:hypothetical protein